MKKQFTEVRSVDGIRRTRLWCEFKYPINGKEYFFKVTTGLRSKEYVGSPLVITEKSTGYKMCDIPFSMIVKTRVSEQENDYRAAGIEAVRHTIKHHRDVDRAIDDALVRIESERVKWDDDIPF